MVGPIVDDAEAEWLAARGVSLGVSTEAALERALRLRARCPTMSVDLGLHWAIANTAALELRKLGCRVRLYGVDLGETYCSYGDLYYAEWRALGISEMVISVATDLAQEPFDWLVKEPRLHEEDLRMDDVRTEIELAGVPVLLSVRSSVRGALDFQRTYLPQAAGVFFGLGRDPDYGGHCPARVTLDELVGRWRRPGAKGVSGGRVPGRRRVPGVRARSRGTSLARPARVTRETCRAAQP